MEQSLEPRITQLIEPILNEFDAFLVEIGIRGERNTKIIEIFIDTEPGITVDLLSTISRRINDTIEREDTVQGNYRLNISSPGLDRPIKLQRQYKKNIGRTLVVTYLEDGVQKKFVGELTHVDDQKIILRTKSATREFTYNDIHSVYVKLPW